MSLEEKKYDVESNNDWAKNVKGEHLFIDNAESGRKGYFCIGCDKVMEAVIRKKNPKHRSYFRHIPVDVEKDDTPCTFSNRIYREILATDILQRLKRIKVPNLYKYPPRGEEGSPMLLEKANFIEATKVKSQLTFFEDKDGAIKYGKNPDIKDKYLLIRPDVTFFDVDENPILFIELVITHKVTEEKKMRLRRLGIDTVSIIVPKSSEKEIEDNFKITKRVKWEYNGLETNTKYVRVSSETSEGILEFDEQQRRFFEESVKCRKSRLNNTIRTLTKCLAGKSYSNAERDFEREIFRIKEATKREEQELAGLEGQYEDDVRTEFSEGNIHLERQRRELDDREQEFKLQSKNLEKRYYTKREEIEEQRREVEDFEVFKTKLEKRIAEVIQDRERIEEKLLNEYEEEIRKSSSELSRRINALLEARRNISDFSIAKSENERYKRAYEFFRKGTWKKG